MMAGLLSATGTLGYVSACSSFSEDEPTPAGVDAALQHVAPPPGDSGDGATARPFCETHAEASLCADFDRGDPVGFHFIQATGDVTVDQGLFRSPPASMWAVASTGKAFVEGRVEGPSLAKIQRLSFDTYQGAALGDGGVTKDSVIARIAQATGGCVFDIESFGTRARFNTSFPVPEGGFQYETTALSAYPPGGRWAHVEVLLESSGGAVTARVMIDTVVALTPRVTQCPGLSTQASVSIGHLGTSDGFLEPGEARYDNVLFESK